MNEKFSRLDDIGMFFKNRGRGINGFHPSVLWHLYIKLDFEHKYENAENASDANDFLRSVARASEVCQSVAIQKGGQLVEVQGSLLHVVLPSQGENNETIFELAGFLHQGLGTLFRKRGDRVLGWRMVADCGKTLLVNGPSIHGDQSTISLANAANRPAKRLYQQLALSEPQRSLKRNHLEVRNRNGTWTAHNLLAIKLFGNLGISDVDLEAIRTRDLDGQIRNVLRTLNESNSSNSTQISWGWVMRADLDGFTKRVKACYDDEKQLQELALEMLAIMTEAANFAASHEEFLTQLPWAGDNFTAVANYPDKQSYEEAVVEGIVGLSVDFHEDLYQSSRNAQCGGWSQCVAGSYPHGNSAGNVFVALIPVAGRNFLVGAGRGIGKSLQAMSEISPDAQECVLLKEDYDHIHEDYQKHFKASLKEDGTPSSLYKTALVTDLEDERDERDTAPKNVSLTKPFGSTVNIQTCPHSNGY